MARQNARKRDLRSVPPLAEALQYARYDAALERQLYRALDALERLQRMRGGDAVPPPLRMHVDATTEPPTRIWGSSSNRDRFFSAKRTHLL